MATPSDDLVGQLIEMLPMPREEAIRRLKANNNDVAAAVDELFSDPDSTKYKWEENAFSSDRDGTTNEAGISFQVHGPDEMDRSGLYSHAPSRPPSRSSNRSPFGPVISLAAEHAAADPRTKFTEEENGDHDLQRALAASAEEYGSQQVGVIEQPYFGPAERPSYDHDEWAMVRSSTQIQEVMPDPDPVDRRRRDDEPAFLKPSTKDHRLSSILTIYHEIPQAREILMNRDKVALNYGYDPEWWAGKPIPSSNPGWTGEGSWDEPSSHDIEDFLHEIQRLMAFLSATERAYGSTEALTQMNPIKLAQSDDPSIESKFFEAWKESCKKTNDEALIPLLFTTAVMPLHNGTDIQDFALLSLEVKAEQDTIYDLADQTLWGESGLELESSAYLDTLAEVIAFRLFSSEHEPRMIRIPTTWYPDRYLKQNTDEALKMRRRKAEIQAEVEELRAKEHKLSYFTFASGQTVKVKDLFAASALHDSDLADHHGQHEADEAQYDETPRRQATVNIAQELEKVMKNIDAKLKQLEEEKEKARVSLCEISKLYTEPTQDPDTPPMHKYTLRGISVDKHVTYVRRRAEPDLISMDDGDDQLDGLEQWWMIEYSSSSAQPVNVEKVTENEVLESAYRNSKKCVVVYASEKAMKPLEPWKTRLPQALETFVETDNEVFRNELAGQQQDAWPEQHLEQEQNHVEFASPRSPPKRKYGESMETVAGEVATQVRWSEGSPPPGPPPSYSRFSPSKPPGNDSSEKNNIASFPSPPTYSRVAGDLGTGYPMEKRPEANVANDNDTAHGDEQEMVEMQTNGDPPRLISTMSMDIREKQDDSMDVDQLPSTESGKQ